MQPQPQGTWLRTPATIQCPGCGHVVDAQRSACEWCDTVLNDEPDAGKGSRPAAAPTGGAGPRVPLPVEPAPASYLLAQPPQPAGLGSVPVPVPFTALPDQPAQPGAAPLPVPPAGSPAIGLLSPLQLDRLALGADPAVPPSLPAGLLPSPSTPLPSPVTPLPAPGPLPTPGPLPSPGLLRSPGPLPSPSNPLSSPGPLPSPVNPLSSPGLLASRANPLPSPVRLLTSPAGPPIPSLPVIRSIGRTPAPIANPPIAPAAPPSIPGPPSMPAQTGPEHAILAPLTPALTPVPVPTQVPAPVQMAGPMAVPTAVPMAATPVPVTAPVAAPEQPAGQSGGRVASLYAIAMRLPLWPTSSSGRISGP